MRVELAAEDKALTADSKQAVEYGIRARAREFALEPSLLEGIEKGLSNRSPKKMRAIVVALIDEEMTAPRRSFGFGGFIPLINLHGALHYADQCISIESREHAR